MYPCRCVPIRCNTCQSYSIISTIFYLLRTSYDLYRCGICTCPHLLPIQCSSHSGIGSNLSIFLSEVLQTACFLLLVSIRHSYSINIQCGHFIHPLPPPSIRALRLFPLVVLTAVSRCRNRRCEGRLMGRQSSCMLLSWRICAL